jgi:glycosyltransferase involved in cell wall biosynthesis
MKKIPFVSIVVPVFNRRERLLTILPSLLEQNYLGQFEIILVDDGSTDGACENLIEDSRIRVVKQLNRGAAAARHTGVLSSRGELIVFHDSDDWALACKVSTLSKALMRFPSCGMAVARTRSEDLSAEVDCPIWADGLQEGDVRLISDALEHFTQHHFPLAAAMNLALRRDVALKASKIPDRFRVANDYYLQLKAALNCRVVGVNEFTTIYHDTSDRSITAMHGYTRQQFYALLSVYYEMLRAQKKSDHPLAVTRRIETATSDQIIDSIIKRRHMTEFFQAVAIYLRKGRLLHLPRELYWAFSRVTSR